MSLYTKLAIFYLFIAIIFFALAYYKRGLDRVLDAFYNGFDGIIHHAEEVGSEAQETGDEGSSDTGQQTI